MKHYLNKTINYLDSSGNSVTVADIFKGFKFLDKYKSNQSYFQEYSIQDGETPEMVSENVYQTPDNWWILLLFNGISDAFFDWPMSSSELEAWAGKLYDRETEPAEYLQTLQDLIERNETNRRILVPSIDVVNNCILELKGF